jgi:hypothetical protein
MISMLHAECEGNMILFCGGLPWERWFFDAVAICIDLPPRTLPIVFSTRHANDQKKYVVMCDVRCHFHFHFHDMRNPYHTIHNT